MLSFRDITLMVSKYVPYQKILKFSCLTVIIIETPDVFLTVIAAFYILH